MNAKENIKKIIIEKPLTLDCGKTINNYSLAYETYGKLNDKKDNAILAFHALTGDQFVSGTNPITNKSGWWTHTVGPNKAIDNIICIVNASINNLDKYNTTETLELEFVIASKDGESLSTKTVPFNMSKVLNK